MRSKVGALFAAFGIICLAYFAAVSVYTGGTLDLGWIWAIGGVCLILFGAALAAGVKSPAVVFLLRAVAAVGMAAAVLLGVLLFRIIVMMRPVQTPPLAYAVVLGAQVKGTRPSKSLRLRLERAADFARDNPETILVLSGGQGPGEDITEAACMQGFLLEQGIGEEQIIMETRSTSTRENLQFSDALTGCAENKTGIISSDFHICRAMEMARDLGYKDVYAVPAPSDTLLLPHFILREAAAIAVMKIGKVF